MVSIIPNTEQASDSAQGGKSTKAGESDEDITMDISQLLSMIVIHFLRNMPYIFLSVTYDTAVGI